MGFAILMPKELADKLKSVGLFEEFIDEAVNCDYEDIDKLFRKYFTAYDIKILNELCNMLTGIPNKEELKNFLSDEDNCKITSRDRENTYYMSDSTNITSYLGNNVSLYVLEDKLNQYKLKDLQVTLFYKLFKHNRRVARYTLDGLYSIL